MCWLQCLGMCLGLSPGKSIVALLTFWWGFGFNFQVSWCLKKSIQVLQATYINLFFLWFLVGRMIFLFHIFSIIALFLSNSKHRNWVNEKNHLTIHSWANKVPAFYFKWEKFPELVAAWKSLVVRGTSRIFIILHMLFRIETICTSVISPSLPLIPPPFFFFLN